MFVYSRLFSSANFFPFLLFLRKEGKTARGSKLEEYKGECENERGTRRWTIFLTGGGEERCNDGLADDFIYTWRLLIAFLSLKGKMTRRRVTSTRELTRLKARNWFSSGATPILGRDTALAKKKLPISDVHRLPLNYGPATVRITTGVVSKPSRNFFFSSLSSFPPIFFFFFHLDSRVIIWRSDNIGSRITSSSLTSWKIVVREGGHVMFSFDKSFPRTMSRSRKLFKTLETGFHAF